MITLGLKQKADLGWCATGFHAINSIPCWYPGTDHWWQTLRFLCCQYCLVLNYGIRGTKIVVLSFSNSRHCHLPTHQSNFSIKLCPWMKTYTKYGDGSSDSPFLISILNLLVLLYKRYFIPSLLNHHIKTWIWRRVIKIKCWKWSSMYLVRRYLKVHSIYDQVRRKTDRELFQVLI